MKNLSKLNSKYYLILIIFINVLVMGYQIYAQRYRGLLDIDESGYSIMAIKNWNSFSEGGLFGLIDTAIKQPLHAPLQPLLASFFYILFGPKLILNFIVPLSSFIGITIVIYKILEKNYSNAIAFSGAVIITSLASIRDYASTFNFAELTTFFVLLYFYRMNSGIRSNRFNTIQGLILTLIFLSRTVSIIYVVSLLAAYVIIQLVKRTQTLLIIKDVVLQITVFVIGSLLWLINNYSTLKSYFLNFGYGNRAKEYGNYTSLLSLIEWRNFLIKIFVTQQNFLSLAFFAIGIIVFCIRLSRRNPIFLNKKSILNIEWQSELISLISVITFSSIFLMSTPNKGSGFDLALITLFSLLIYQLICFRSRDVLGITTLILSITISITQIINIFIPVKLDLVIMKVNFPLVKQTTIIKDYLNYGMYRDTITPRNQQFPYLMKGKDENNSWNKSNLEIIRFLELRNIDSQYVHFGFRHILVNPNSINLIRNYEEKNDIPIKFLPAFELQFKDERETIEILEDQSFFESCTILLSNGQVNEILPNVNQAILRAEMQKRGFTIAKESIILPDLRSIQIYTSKAVCINYNSAVEFVEN
jgi:hypothetical protein